MPSLKMVHDYDEKNEGRSFLLDVVSPGDIITIEPYASLQELDPKPLSVRVEQAATQFTACTGYALGGPLNWEIERLVRVVGSIFNLRSSLIRIKSLDQDLFTEILYFDEAIVTSMKQDMLEEYTENGTMTCDHSLLQFMFGPEDFAQILNQGRVTSLNPEVLVNYLINTFGLGWKKLSPIKIATVRLEKPVAFSPFDLKK